MHCIDERTGEQILEGDMLIDPRSNDAWRLAGTSVDELGRDIALLEPVGPRHSLRLAVEGNGCLPGLWKA